MDAVALPEEERFRHFHSRWQSPSTQKSSEGERVPLIIRTGENLNNVLALCSIGQLTRIFPFNTYFGCGRGTGPLRP